jgi:glycosyltransferase involved in cell wall biosynthesis
MGVQSVEQRTLGREDIETGTASANEDAAVELTILMPCLNEAETLAVCIRKAAGYLASNGIRGEVLIADNGSTDGSQAIAEREGARVTHVPVRGYGAAIHYGSLAARGRYVIVGDADDSYDFSRLDPFVERLRAGDDLVMGNRFRGGVRKGAMPWKNRYIGNPLLTGIGRLFFRCPASDFHCGLRGYSRDAYRKLDLRTTGMEFASEMVIKATLLNMRIAEVPTTLDPDGRSRPPHLRPWRDGWRHLVFMLLYSPRWLFLIPGVLTFTLGTAAMAWLWSGPRQLGPNIALDVHSMTYAAMAILIGFQMIAFAMLSRVFAHNEGLRPPDAKFNRVFKYLKLEVGLIVGFVVFLLGVIGTIFAINTWNSVGFGPLDPGRVMRLVIPSGLALTLGVEIMLFSFFFSILGLKVRRMDAARPG